MIKSIIKSMIKSIIKSMIKDFIPDKKCPGFPHKAGFPAAAPTTVASEYVQGLVLLLLGWALPS